MAILSSISSTPEFITVGTEKPIELPVKEGVKKCHQINRAGHSSVYEIDGSSPGRIYKAISLKNFENGDEIRASKIAGRLGIGPVVHDTFVLKQNTNKFVIIEMDYAGKTFQDWREDVEIEKIQQVDEKNPREYKNREKQIQEATLKLRQVSLKKSKFCAIQIHNKPEAEVSETAERIFGTQEQFYFSLFSRLKQLAENRVSYGDIHFENIIPISLVNQSLQLIDFDMSSLHETVEDARQQTIKSWHVWTNFHQYIKLPNLSEESKELIRWFAEGLL